MDRVEYTVENMSPAEYVKFYNLTTIKTYDRSHTGYSVDRVYAFQPIHRSITQTIKHGILGEKPEITLDGQVIEYNLFDISEKFEQVLAYGEILVIFSSEYGVTSYTPNKYKIQRVVDGVIYDFDIKDGGNLTKYRSVDATNFTVINTKKNINTVLKLEVRKIQTPDGLPCYSSADELIREYNRLWILQQHAVEITQPLMMIPDGYMQTNKEINRREENDAQAKKSQLNSFVFDKNATHFRRIEGASEEIIVSDFKYDFEKFEKNKLDVLRQISSAVQVDLPFLLKDMDGGFKTATEVITNRHALYQTVEMYKGTLVRLIKSIYGLNAEVIIYDSIKDDQTEYYKALQADVASGIIDQIQYVMERYSKTEEEARLMVTGSESKDETKDLRNRMDIVDALGDNISIEQRVAILYPSMNELERLREVVLIKIEQGLLLTSKETQYAISNGLIVE